MKRSAGEWLSIQTAKKPGRVVIGAILLFNLILILISSAVISRFGLSGTEKMNFFEAAFTTITMILDAGCIQFVIADIGRAGVGISIFCLIVILLGMISFTGAIIGYLTNAISQYIENANAGTKKLRLSNHFVILNWNTRASEIINDLLYCKGKQVVVVLVEKGKQEIEREVGDRLQDTIAKENAALREQIQKHPFLKRCREYHRGRVKNNVVLIVREGDVFSSKELRSICLKDACTIIILGNDEKIAARLNKSEANSKNRGNPLTVKALMQVSDIVASAESADHQRIVVEVTDAWTGTLVDHIIANKEIEKKCKIVPVQANKILGQLLSQFSLMPELNLAYKELFSNKGATFYSIPLEGEVDEQKFISEYLASHASAIPLTTTVIEGKTFAFFSAGRQEDIDRLADEELDSIEIKLNTDYHIEDKNVVIIGHNSKCRDIMNGFASFQNEWHYDDPKHEVLRVTVIDDQEHLEEVNYYREYPFRVDTVVGTVYDNEMITALIDRMSRANAEDTSILILSDDQVPNDAVDANVLANLVFAQDQIHRRMQEKNFDPDSIDIIAEIIDPKHFDVVSTYSVRNVVISNRYISKMITQIGEKDALFDFYTDILSYDEDDGEQYESKEIYVKKASQLFEELPPPCKVSQLIRGIYRASTDPSLKGKKRNPTLLLGVVKASGKMILFSGEQDKSLIQIEAKDKLIVFSNH